ncbi:MAG: hypothetical protein ABIV94_10715 [Acidimicrobiales bacterium]
MPNGELEDRTPIVPPGRRGWLIATAVTALLVVATIVFLATRGGGTGRMPGMDMRSLGPSLSVLVIGH